MTSNRRINYLHVLNKKIEGLLSSPRAAAWSCITAIATFLTMLTIGYFVAQGDPAGPSSDAAGFNIFDNRISDLGAARFTPNVIFLDYGAMITPVLFIPTIYYLERKFAPIPRNINEYQGTSRWRFRLTTFGSFFMMLGLIGLFGIGLFSIDRNEWLMTEYSMPVSLHDIFAGCALGGLGIAGVILGFFITFYRNKFIHLAVRIPLGIWMMVVPLACGINLISYLPPLGMDHVEPSAPYWEWMMLFAILAWLVPLSILVIVEAIRDSRK
ncbi:MAG: hypothetical protein ACFFCS_12545 [Candidatus Hodarchaeota archaeon]